MEEEARKIVQDHKRPLRKLHSVGSKLLLNECKFETEELVFKNLEHLKNALSHQKVEKRSSRANAEWEQTLQLAKLNKVVKGLLENFGYQDKSGMYMYPEEMLYLVETNRLEVSLKTAPLSVQECFDIALKSQNLNLTKYRAYKKLVQKGYRVIRFSEVMRRKQQKKIAAPNEQKRKDIESIDNSPIPKRIAVDKTVLIEQKRMEVDEFYTKLRNKGPCLCLEENVEYNPDYCIFLPDNHSRIEWNFDFYISKAYVMDNPVYKRPAIHAVCSGDNISFFKMGTVNLPVLSA